MLPCFWENIPHAVEEPVDLLLLTQEYAAENETEASVPELAGVVDGQGAAPGTTEEVPFLYAQVFAEALDVLNQMLRGVVLQAAEGVGASGAALVEDYDAEKVGIEEASVGRRCTRAGAAVQEKDRHAVGVAALLPIEIVKIVHGEKARGVGGDGGEEVQKRASGDIGKAVFLLPCLLR